MKKLLLIIAVGIVGCNDTATNVHGISEMVYKDSIIEDYNKRVDTLIEYAKSKGYTIDNITFTKK